MPLWENQFHAKRPKPTENKKINNEMRSNADLNQTNHEHAEYTIQKDCLK